VSFKSVRHLLLGVAIVAAGCVATAGPTGARTAAAERGNGSASVGGEGGDARRGLTLDAETSRSSLARISVRFRKGAEVRLRRRDEAYTYARYYLGQTRDTVQFGGRLLVPARHGSDRFRLRFRPLRNGSTQPARVTAILRTGRKPSLVIKAFPADTTVFRLITVGAGDRGTRATFCRRERVRYAGRMRIVLSTGARMPGDASGGYVCRNLPPARCEC
jgi:hypothetical protein